MEVPERPGGKVRTDPKDTTEKSPPVIVDASK